MRDRVTTQASEGSGCNGLTQSEREDLKARRRENRALKPAKEILPKGEPVETPLVQAHWRPRFRSGEPTDTKIIDDHRGACGVEAICRVLPIAPSTDQRHRAVARVSPEGSAQAQRDAARCAQCGPVGEASGKCSGPVTARPDLAAESEEGARCTIVSLPKRVDMQGVTRGNDKKTVYCEPALPCPEGLCREKRQWCAMAERSDCSCARGIDPKVR